VETELEGKPKIEGENENLSDNEIMILQLVQKNAKLKKKLLAERKLGEIKLFFFILSWVFTVILCVLFLLKSNCKD